MCENLQFSANSGLAVVSVANPNRDGTGSMSKVISGVGMGTIINSLSIKAQGTNSLGMIRFFIHDGATKYLFLEVPIPANRQNATHGATQIELDGPLKLATGYELFASTEIGEPFSILANAENWTMCPCPE